MGGALKRTVRRRIVIGIVLCGWISLSYYSFREVRSKDQRLLFCGTIEGFYGVSHKRTVSEYVLIRMDDGYVADMYQPWLSARHVKGDHICYRWSQAEVYGVGGVQIIWLLVCVLNLSMGVVGLIGGAIYCWWRWL